MKNAKDKYRRQDFYKNMCRLHFYKYIQKNHSIPEEIRFFYKKKNALLCKQKSLVKIRNRCIYTGRSRGVYKFCKLSRNLLQEKALSGDLLGFSKSSW